MSAAAAPEEKGDGVEAMEVTEAVSHRRQRAVSSRSQSLFFASPTRAWQHTCSPHPQLCRCAIGSLGREQREGCSMIRTVFCEAGGRLRAISVRFIHVVSSTQ